MKLKNNFNRILKFFKVKSELYDYYKNLDPSELPISILKIIHQATSIPVYITKREIKAFDSSFQCTPTLLKQQINGKLVGKKKQPQWLRNYEVYFFKKIFTSTKLFIQAHFLKKELFYIKYKFSLSNEQELLEMKQSLVEKYCLVDVLAINSFYIKDQNQNILYVDIKNYAPTQVYFIEVKFVSGNFYFKQEISKIVNQSKNQEIFMKYQKKIEWSTAV